MPAADAREGAVPDARSARRSAVGRPIARGPGAVRRQLKARTRRRPVLATETPDSNPVSRPPAVSSRTRTTSSSDARRRSTSSCAGSGRSRFLSVVGTSGSGKSSLVRSGLIPSLYSGMMVKAGSSWRVAIMRPGEDPIGHLAAALDAPDVLGEPDGELAGTQSRRCSRRRCAAAAWAWSSPSARRGSRRRQRPDRRRPVRGAVPLQAQPRDARSRATRRSRS